MPNLSKETKITNALLLITLAGLIISLILTFSNSVFVYVSKIINPDILFKIGIYLSLGSLIIFALFNIYQGFKYRKIYALILWVGKIDALVWINRDNNPLGFWIYLIGYILLFIDLIRFIPTIIF